MIPIVPASGKRGAFTTGALSFLSETPSISEEYDLRQGLVDAYEKTQSDESIILFDVDGFRSRFLNNELVKEIRIKGRDLLFVTYIENVEDVISALTGSFSGVGIPLHTVDDYGVLEDANILSETAFPVAFVRKGKEISTGQSVDKLSETICGYGFDRLLVFDMDSRESEFVWL